MDFDKNGEFFRGSYATLNMFGTEMPLEYSGARSEYLACRSTAWLGGALNCSPVYDVSGQDAAKVLTRTCVNKDFSLMQPNTSKHALICNEKGNMTADGVIMYKGDNVWRSYWLAPVLQYYVEKGEREGLDVHGSYHEDEYFFQIDGPKSLEILEEATQTDLHDIKFAKNKDVKICGTDMVVHRLGMSGALAYEVHGNVKDKEIAYARLRETLEKNGGKPLGFRNYVIINHTPAGYPNQYQHFLYDFTCGEDDFIRFCRDHCFPQFALGSAIVDQNIFHVSPYDISWGYLVNFNHEFIGKAALAEIKANQKKQIVTLEWNTEDVGEVFMSQFRGRAVKPYEPIEAYHSSYNGSSMAPTRGDFVMKDGRITGVATGRTYAFYEQRMISLAIIDKADAILGNELSVLWGAPGYPQKEIRAVVAPFPYYNGEFRNETFDTEKIPHPDFAAANSTSIEGSYDVVVNTIIGDQPGSFTYHLENKELTGTATAMNTTVDIYNGTVDGRKITHNMMMATPLGKMEIKVSAELYGDRLTGTMTAGPMSMNFIGTRRKAAR